MQNVLTRPTMTNDGNEPAGEGPARLLVVDDVEDNRRILTRRFKRRGFEIDEASGGREALEKIENGRYDLVLLDIMMPDIDGMEVLSRTRETRSAAELPIIMVTAKSESTDVVAALEATANDYVTKPVDFDVCLARVNAQVARKRLAEKERSQADVIALDNERIQKDRDAKDAELEHLALHDRLTGIPNRTAFVEEISRTLADMSGGQRPTAGTDIMVAIGFDGFRAVNDSMGREAGDEVLRIAAWRIRSWCDEDAFVARVGGDEFALILRGTHPEAALERTETLALELGKAFQIGEGAVIVTASCGLAAIEPSAGAPDDVLRHAHAALIAAKKIGPSGVKLFEPGMLQSLERRRSLQLDLRTALLRDQLDLHFQPQVDPRQGRVTGFEALLRWRHPSKGQVPPGEFIPLAEETGTIVAIGTWVLREACTIAAGWQNDCRVAVNISPLQIAQPDFLSLLAKILRDTGLAPERLELELTETYAFDCSEEKRAVLAEARRLGVTISIDDFGTGFASMSYLQKLDFDKIKIDKCFIDELCDENNQRAAMIVRSIINLGERMGVTTTAEGVETAAQLRMLCSEGCGEIQGYYYAAPMGAQDIPAFLARFDEGRAHG